MMNVEQAMQQRHSVRAFLPRTVDAVLVRDLLAQAGQAASGGNLQPWRVIALTGDSLQALRQAMPAATWAAATSLPAHCTLATVRP
mgnify:CR=1 FL=1